MSSKKICHFTSVHNPLDERIFLKECVSLHNAGYDVSIVAKGDSFEKMGIHIIGCGYPNNRLERMLFFSRKIYTKVREENYDLYHFHDPELLPYGLRLAKEGKKVIFDSHEEVAAQILDKNWLPPRSRRLISGVYSRYEAKVLKRFVAIIAATARIAQTLKSINPNIVVINNYPKLDDIVFQDTPFSNRESLVCYVGSISKNRGEDTMKEVMDGIDADLILAGKHAVERIPTKREGHYIDYIGQVDRTGVNAVYGKSKLGLLFFLHEKNHLKSQPVKMFEYMAAGLPIVATDFPLWREIIEKKSKCGICVDVNDPDEVVSVMSYLLSNDSIAEEMGINGRRAVEREYNWEIEEKKLLNLYEAILE